MSESTVTHVELLLQRTDWARALARRLVEDASEADDLVQESLAVALEHAPRRGVPVLSWFARVMRNLARERRRAHARRELRERLVAREEREGGSHEEVLERFEQHRVLAEELACLAEPYRGALLLRYFDGLAPEEIASRAGENVRTIHSRLHRGLALLRARLKRRAGGDEGAWALALFPLGLGQGGLAGSVLGGLLVNAQAKIAIAVAVVGLLAATIVLVPHSTSPRSTAVPVRAKVADASGEPAAIEDAAPAPTERTALAGESSSESHVPPPAPAGALASVRGRVLDSEARPLANVEVGLRAGADVAAPEPRARSGLDGNFALSAERFADRLTVASPEWTAVFEPVVFGGEDSALVIAARSLELAGEIVDESRTPIARAELSYVAPDELRKRFPVVLDGASVVERATSSDAFGRFELARVPAAAGGVLRVRREGFEPESVDVGESSRSDLVVVLRASTGATLLEGLVEDEHGATVEGALVVLGQAIARTDAGGAFRLTLERAGAGRVLHAVKAGHLPATLECATPGSSERGAWPDPLVLRLGGAPRALAGVVLDTRGAPVAHAQVSIVDRTFLGLIEANFGSELVTMPQWIEPELSGQSFSTPVETDASGRFRIEGLLARTYTVQAFAKATLAYGKLLVEAGREDVELRVGCESELPVVRGRVVGRSGAPVPGARVRPQRTILESSSVADEPPHPIEVSGDAVVSDEDGRFELTGLCREARTLVVIQPTGFGSARVSLEDRAALDNLVVVLPLDCHVQVDLESSGLRADNLRLLDAAGKPVTLVVYHGDLSYASEGFGFDSPRTEAFVVPDDAATLVLLDGEHEVARIPLALKAGELNVIRP